MGTIMKATTKKTVLEVYPEIYARVRKQAVKANQSTKRFTTLLLEFGIEKLESGQIGLIDASVSDAPQRSTIKLPARRGINQRKGGTI